MWAVIRISYDDDYKHCTEPARIGTISVFDTEQEASVFAHKKMWKELQVDACGPIPDDQPDDDTVDELWETEFRAHYYEGVCRDWVVRPVNICP